MNQTNPVEEASVKKLLNRLSRLEGQLRGVRRMIEAGDGCSGIITQLSAVKQAAAGLALELLENEVLCRLDRGEPIDKKHLEAIIKMK